MAAKYISSTHEFWFLCPSYVQFPGNEAVPQAGPQAIFMLHVGAPWVGLVSDHPQDHHHDSELLTLASHASILYVTPVWTYFPQSCCTALPGFPSQLMQCPFVRHKPRSPYKPFIQGAVGAEHPFGPCTQLLGLLIGSGDAAFWSLTWDTSLTPGIALSTFSHWMEALLHLAHPLCKSYARRRITLSFLEGWR